MTQTNLDKLKQLGHDVDDKFCCKICGHLFSEKRGKPIVKGKLYSDKFKEYRFSHFVIECGLKKDQSLPVRQIEW
jgi:rubredoxin